MIAITTASRIEGYQIMAYKGTAQGATFDDLLKNAEALGANAVLNTCYDNALGVDTFFHGTAVVIELVKPPVGTLMNPESELLIVTLSRRSQ